ncbi:MAG: PaaI family thioesterase [Thermoleophilaceae bacterium]|nr:PaaI family thioesterase [Thermoleophilaceae bacterium]
MSKRDSRLVHHDLCFGCGPANLFGLQLELERRPGGGVEGRFFVKQDHQGPPGYAHGGVLAAALDEAMALLLHGEEVFAVTGRLEVDLLAPAPVGTFVRVAAELEGSEERSVLLRASAFGEAGNEVAGARGIFVRAQRGRAGADGG